MRYAIKILPIALVILCACLYFALSPEKEIKSLNKMHKENEVVSRSEMINPSFHGTDEKNRPFSIAAKYGTKTDDNKIELRKLSGKLHSDGNSQFILHADHGFMVEDKSSLEVHGNVEISSNNGEKFVTESLNIEPEKHIAYNNSPVLVSGEIGIIEAQGFNMEEYGKKVIFVGRVKTSLNINEEENKK